MRTYADWIKALKIFAKYEPKGEDELCEVSADHDIIYIGLDPEKVDADDIVELQELGFHADDDHTCFYKFA